MRRMKSWMAVIAAFPFFALAPIAHAQLVPTYQYTQAGFGTPGSIEPLSVPGTYHYGNSHSPGANIADAQGTISPLVSFYDGFVFSIDGAVANSATITIDLGDLLGIANLSARIFEAEGNLPPTLRTPVAGSIIERWSEPLASGEGEAVVLSNVLLNPGTYVLQIRGLVTGTSSGSYAGVLNLAEVPAVPVPAAVWLLASALGAFRLVSKRSAS